MSECGWRGIFPATILAHIESALNRPISSIFKAGLTGTSTGALIALGLAARRNMQDPSDQTPLFTAQGLVGFYKEHKSEIFNDHCCLGCQDSTQQESNGDNFVYVVPVFAASCGAA